MKRPSLLPLLGGVAVGFLNGLLGAGGGMLTVPLLEHNGLPPQKSHATSLAIILPLSVLSAGLYWYRGWFSPAEALPYLPGGLLGAAAGAALLPRLNTARVKVVFAALLLWSAARLLHLW